MEARKGDRARTGTGAAGVGESGPPPRRNAPCELCHTRATSSSSMGMLSASSFKPILIRDVAAGQYFFFFNLKIAIWFF